MVGGAAYAVRVGGLRGGGDGWDLGYQSSVPVVLWNAVVTAFHETTIAFPTTVALGSGTAGSLALKPGMNASQSMLPCMLHSRTKTPLFPLPTLSSVFPCCWNVLITSPAGRS